jgi:hypothetical protein
MHLEAIPDSGHSVAGRRHQHAGCVDGDVAAGRGQDLEDGGRVGGDRSLDGEALFGHKMFRSRELPRRRSRKDRWSAQPSR